MLDTAAARYFHAHNGDAFDVVVTDDLSELFAVIALVQLGAADQRDLIADKILMEACIGIGCAFTGTSLICTGH